MVVAGASSGTRVIDGDSNLTATGRARVDFELGDNGDFIADFKVLGDLP